MIQFWVIRGFIWIMKLGDNYEYFKYYAMNLW